jgi:uncharacterized membrane protein YhaH (DUF805 family)
MLSILSSHLGGALWIGGRSGRLEWWVVHTVVSALMKANTDLLIEPSHPTILGTPVPNGLLIGVLNLFVLFWISAASIVRRLRDRNKSAWWAILYPWPIIGWGWCVIECGFLAGRAPPPEELELEISGPVQRRRRRPWTPARIARAAGNVVGLALLALVLYKWFFEPPGKLPVFENKLETPAEPAQPL